eukprot:TRINITY_DN3158_c0_g2_i1.p1 TRINITY_DN3158_c0_g2~~TRINITY_DN3158_c0_g2_i1.p1  ORF type:complete len:122 (-),score=22.73 TRINITY_DN3158_c0_g2_i1:59-424(-)
MVTYLPTLFKPSSLLSFHGPSFFVSSSLPKEKVFVNSRREDKNSYLPVGLMFIETSAKTGENVDEVFVKCAKTILNKIESGVIKPEEMGSGIQVGNFSKSRGSSTVLPISNAETTPTIECC